MSYDVLESNVTYDGRILQVTMDKIEMPDGKAAYRETVIRKKNAAAVLPVAADGRILFVRQYRHAFGEVLLEIPAGVIDGGETAADCAARELEEETGQKAGRLEYLCEMYPTVGFCSERIFLYFAFDLTEGTQRMDEDEFVEVESHTLEDALEMISRGEIKDGKTIAALFAYKTRNK